MKYLAMLALLGLAACNSTDATGPSTKPSLDVVPPPPTCPAGQTAVAAWGRRNGQPVFVGWYCTATHS